MFTTPAADCCPECGCTGLIEASRGLTCTTCGLVLEETASFVVHDQRGKEGIVASHAVLHGSTTTLVGKLSERGVGNAALLSRVQQRTVTYADFKRSRVYHLVSGAVAAAQLPAIVVDHAMHVHGKISAIATRGSSMAGCSMLAAISVFIACKRLTIVQTRDDILDVLAGLGVDVRLFQRNLLRLRAFGKGLDRTTAGRQSIMSAALAALQNVLGPGDYIGKVSLVHATLAKALVGMREDSAVAVTAFLSLNLLVPRGASLTMLAKALRFRPASLYNATKRVLGKIGIVVDGPLSQANLGVVLRSRVAIGDGLNREALVAQAIVTAEAAGSAGVVQARLVRTIPLATLATPPITIAVPIPVHVRSFKLKITRRFRGVMSKRSVGERFIITTNPKRHGRIRPSGTHSNIAAWWLGAPGPPAVIPAIKVG